MLQVHAPPFVSKETNSNQAIGPAFSRVQRRRSFIKKVLLEFEFLFLDLRCDALFCLRLPVNLHMSISSSCRNGEIELQRVRPMEKRAKSRPRPPRTSAFRRIWTSSLCHSCVSQVLFPCPSPQHVVLSRWCITQENSTLIDQQEGASECVVKRLCFCCFSWSAVIK